MADTNVVTALLLAKCLDRPIVFSSKKNRDARESIDTAATAVFDENPLYVRCHMSSTWKEIVREIAHGTIHAGSRFVVFEGLDRAPRLVQTLLLETLVSRRMAYDGSEVLNLPEGLTIVIIARGHGLVNHLRDHILLEHAVDGPADLHYLPDDTKVSSAHVAAIARNARDVTIVPELKQYMQDIIVHLRTHRFLRKGVSPRAVKDFDSVVRVLCALQSYDFATPSIIQTAARKVFPLKIELCDPSDEPTLQYGSDIELIRWWLSRVDEDIIVDDVLRTVASPM